MKLNINDTFNKELPADPIIENSRRQVKDAAFSFVSPRMPSSPKLLHASSELAKELGITTEEVQSQEFLKVFSGQEVIHGTRPYAMCYGGHQFGNWAGQLGDGRAINLFEVYEKQQRWALQLKGAGETPYSRSADGLAVLRSSIREHLCSEAMFHLGVPTTRSLSLALTGDEVMRDVMYDGHPALEKGAVVCRVAPSFIRFGNFQIFASRKDETNIKTLADYTIDHFYPHLNQDPDTKYIAFFKEIVDRTLEMVIHWQRVGFVHGVMNTDNMSILGLTIDYGPYGWLEGYDEEWTPNTTDKQHKRYRYGNQPSIALWNLFQLANALFPLINDTAPLEKALDQYKIDYQAKYYEMMCAKLGISSTGADGAPLISSLLETLKLSETDFTILFRTLAEVRITDTAEIALGRVAQSFYNREEITGQIKAKWLAWFTSYTKYLFSEKINDTARRAKMHTVNPKYVLRNYMAQLAIDNANRGDYNTINELYELLRSPYTEQEENERWFAKRPEWARHKVGCSMLSCSS